MVQITAKRSRARRTLDLPEIEVEALRRCYASERAERRRYAGLLDGLMRSLSVPVLVLDDVRTVVQANDAARELYGDDVVGGCWQSHARSREERIGDETIVVVDVAAARNERLQMLGASQAALAHQIRSPLTVAGLSVEQVMASVEGAGAHANLARVQRSLTAIERHISNALVFVRGELPERTAFSLEELASALQEAWQPLLGEELTWWRGEFAPLEQVCGDRAALVSAMTNVVENALSVGGAGTRVSVALAIDGAIARLSVSDDGPGMTPQMRATAREPFVSGRSGGTGLGLAIADAVVRAHGGSLDIESTLGSGTCVTALLPLISKTAEGACE